MCHFYCMLALSFYEIHWCRDSIGDSTIMGDHRWAGTFGVNVDFVARSHCSVEMILLEDMHVSIDSMKNNYIT